ncbi:uncharacterized protein LOC102715498 [Oryza brachyantha]|uniref:uncharacterized protein LOC102715498 n=1 Tax=Oryza brachyantha TaxID=4533 RepID=UPI001ADCAFAE|nr:uncharacterized protein LOC102715498 [Oryza brachyantha]
MSSSASSTPRAGGGGGSGGGQHTPPLPHPAAHGNGHGHGGGGGGGGGRGGGAEHVRLMCSFGGRILPRPGDHQLRYVGGETRIVSVPRAATFEVLVAALAKVAPALFPQGGTWPALRYQLPQDDLDALISITSDDDVDNLIEEIDRFQGLAAATLKPPRLRLFLFASSPDHSAAAFGSVLSGACAGDASSDQWFVDALNAPAPAPIERGRSEASSIISEVPDYLFGLDTTSDEPSPGPGGARPKVETEMAHGEDDALSRSTPPAPYVTETTPWPAPPPPYMTQQVYYVPVRPVHHYLDPSSQGGYMPGPVYHIVGGGGSEARGDLYSTTGTGGVYGVPHPMQPFPPMMYGHAPPPGSVVYSSEGKPPAEGGAHPA